MGEAASGAKRSREDEGPEETPPPANRSSARVRKDRRNADGVLGVDNTILLGKPVAKKPPPRRSDPPPTSSLWLKVVGGRKVLAEEDDNDQPQLPPARAKPPSAALSALRPSVSSRAPAEGHGSI